MVDLRERLAAEWRPAGTTTDRSRLTVASITAETTLFEHRATADALEPVTEGEIPARSLFAIAIDFQPSLPTLGITPEAALSMAAPRAKRLFLDRIEADGLLVEEQLSSDRFDRADGATGRRYTFSTAVELDSGAASVAEKTDAENADDGGRTGSNDGSQIDSDDGYRTGNNDGYRTGSDDAPRERIDCETHVAIWPTATSYGMGGGTVPIDAPAHVADAVAIDPDRDRETVREFVRTIDTENDAA